MFTESPQDPEHPEMICEIVMSRRVEPDQPCRRALQSGSRTELFHVLPKRLEKLHMPLNYSKAQNAVGR